jgi:hypothetical protein
MLKRIERWLESPRAPVWLGLLAVLLCLPALRFDLQADDHLFLWKLEHGGSPFALFQIEPEGTQEGREVGYLVWWSSPHLHARFLRPVASLSHALDFTLWPRAAWWMHLTNAFIYGAMVWLAALLYRRLAASAAIASLAALMFAIDGGHAFSAGWISGRNTLLASMFALLALWFHVRAQDEQRAWLRVASAGSVALALLSAEAGVWSLALLASYTIALDSGPVRARLRSIAGPLAVGAVWAGCYVALQCGFRGSSFYRDPSSPVQAFAQGVLDLPIWFSAMFGLGDFALALLQPALWVRLAALLVALCLSWLLWPALKTSRACRFFALAFLLCLAPVLCTLPTARVLIGSSFGALGWVACSVVAARTDASLRGRLTARTLLAFHLWLAPLLFVPALGATQSFANGTTRILAAIKPARDVIIVRAPVELLSNYVLLASTQRSRLATAARSVHHLYTGASALWAERVDPRTLEVEVERGWGYVPIERIFCAVADLPRTAQEVRLGAFTARVLSSTPDGLPKRVRFTFPTALESSERQWLSWDQNRVVPWTPPALGQRVSLPPLSFIAALR